MIDPSYNIRVSAHAALSGIYFRGQEVPVFDQQAADDSLMPHIILQDVTGGGNRFSKCGFGGDWDQIIKVTSQHLNDVSQNPVDIISNEILNRLVPNASPFMVMGDGFQVLRISAFVLGTQVYQDATMTYIDKNIRITYSLIEQ